MANPIKIIQQADGSEDGYDRVVSFLRDQLVTGNLKTGDRLLPERDLATALGVSRPVFTPASQITAKRSSTPPVPLGILEKSSLPTAFCAAQKVQWSVAVVCKFPDCNPRHKTSWFSLERNGGLITWAAAVAKSGWR